MQFCGVDNWTIAALAAERQRIMAQIEVAEDFDTGPRLTGVVIAIEAAMGCIDPRSDDECLSLFKVLSENESGDGIFNRPDYFSDPSSADIADRILDYLRARAG